jgi:hypothetical protein
MEGGSLQVRPPEIHVVEMGPVELHIAGVEVAQARIEDDAMAEVGVLEVRLTGCTPGVRTDYQRHMSPHQVCSLEVRTSEVVAC